MSDHKVVYVTHRQAKELRSKVGGQRSVELSRLTQFDAFLLADGRVLLKIPDVDENIDEILYPGEAALREVANEANNRTDEPCHCLDGLLKFAESFDIHVEQLIIELHDRFRVRSGMPR